MTVWCRSTWLVTLPSAYLEPGCVTVSSTASLMAMPRLPSDSGSSASTARPALVWSLGLGMTLAPQSCIMLRRYGFWW